ncbi:beta-phosphoglucomutase [Runella sp.]|jgi:beta-phosphoglucomutase|uniref:beta-phosphoglucomutase n=1 Tax=Runella sp. TaxID=1960881 RepID=UPI0026347C41|nr:beta-phosphoglucomutase [Runella sp.]
MQAFLFDLDGVIVDTAHFHYQAWRRLANEKLGFDISEEFNESLKGVSRTESLDRILAEGGVTLDDATKETYATLKNQWYVELVNQMTPDDILPGIQKFLKETRDAGIKIGLGSVSKNARPILEHIGIVDAFDVIIDGTKISKGKPDPEVFLKGAEELGVSPDECVVFEDAVAGIESGKRAGMKTVGIGHPDVLKEADIVLANLNNLAPADLKKTLFSE